MTIDLKNSIKNKLIKWSEEYYNGNEIVPDHIYDSVENFYQTLEDNFDPMSIRKENYRNKVKHWCQLGSLKKTYDLQKIADMFSNSECVSEYKLDGLTLVLQYVDGIFTKSLTRGDGIYGNDVTHIVHEYLTNKYPSLLDLKSDISIQVRGEFIIPDNAYDIFRKFGYVSLRNAASGFINSKSYNSRIEYGEFIAHDVYFVEDDTKYETVKERKDILKSLGFMVVGECNCNFNEEIEIPTSYTDEIGLIYATDGIVFKSNYKSFEFDSSGYPVGDIAYKSEDRINTTTSIFDITWNMKNYTLTPKFVLNPVKMDGGVVKFANAHNYKYIKNLMGKLKKFNLVSLIRAGDIVPQISDIIEFGYGDNIIDEDSIPTSCPHCNEMLTLDNTKTNLICKNKSCHRKKIYRMIQFIKLLEIKNIGEVTVYKLYDTFKCKNIKELYELSSDDWCSIDGLGEKSYIKFNKAFNDIKSKITIDNVLVSMSIPLHGRRTIKSLRSIWKSNDINDIFANREAISNIDNYSEYKLNILQSYCEELRSDINDIMELSEFKETAEPEEQLETENVEVVVTGAHDKYSRRELLSIFSRNGFIITKSFKHAKYLICKDKSSSSSKMKKAIKKGIDILDYDEFFASYIKV